GGVFFLEYNPELLDGFCNLGTQFFREVSCLNDFSGLRGIDANDWVDCNLCQGVRALNCEHLDLHATFYRAHGQVVTVCTVQQYREVELLSNVGAPSDHDLVYGVALDVHTEDVGSVLESFVSGLSNLDAASLATAANLDLCLNYNYAADLLSCGFGFFRGVSDDTGKHGNAVCLE